MKKIFQKSNQRPVELFREEAPHSSSTQEPSTRGQYSRVEKREESTVPSPLNRSVAVTPRSRSARKEQAEQNNPTRSSQYGGAGGAYPSYGEMLVDPQEGRGGIAASLSANRGSAVPMSDRTSHQKLPARDFGERSLAEGQHLRTRSSNVNQPLWNAAQQGGGREYPYYESIASHDNMPHSSTHASSRYETGPRRQGSMSNGLGGMLNRSRSVSKGGSQAQGGWYDDAVIKKPSRRPSLIYGMDSGLHGGQAAVATANANEQEAWNVASNKYSVEKDASVVRPESRYIDRYADIKTLQSATIGIGVDKVKRKLFGKKKKEEKEEDGKAKESSEEWAKVERSTSNSFDHQQQQNLKPVANIEAQDRRGGSHHPHVLTPWLNGTKAQKLTEESITSQLGLLCITEEDKWDWNHIAGVVDLIAHSEAASKEAARALRKEFKLGEEEPRLRAIRLWVIICVRASDRFRLQVANKRFLESLEDLYTDKKGTTRIRGRLLVAWSMLADEYQQDQELSSITKMFNKIKPNDMPMNGMPLNLSHDLFNPSGSVEQQQQQQPPPQRKSGTVPSSQDIYHDHHAVHQQNKPTLRLVEAEQQQQQEQQQLQQQHYQQQQNTLDQTQSHSQIPFRENDDGLALAAPIPFRDDESLQQIARLHDDYRRLHEECQVARSNAQLLLESLIEHGLESDLVKEFADKTQLSQDFILAQIPWASAQVDSSRLEKQDRVANGQAEPEGEKSSSSAEAEVLLDDLLDTHEKLLAAIGMVEEARDRQREEDEERQVIDRSMREQRIDRSQLVQDAVTGDLISIEGGGGLVPPAMDRGQGSSSRSRSPSPAAAASPPTVRRPLPIPGHDPFSMTSSVLSSPPPPSSLPLLDNATSTARSVMRNGQSYPAPPPAAAQKVGGGPRPMNGSDHSSSHMSQSAAGFKTADVDINYDDAEAEDSVTMTPMKPSEKALGKRRAVSIRESISPLSSKGDSRAFELAHQVDNLSMSSAAAAADPAMEATLRARPPPALPLAARNEQQRQYPTTNPFYHHSPTTPQPKPKPSHLESTNQHETVNTPHTNPFQSYN
ncbi:hypothetical protein CBS101457_002382 [Exobasidium rhododendri]|nr:hypothetical protein CBS101457_002382 [Exobasidium rhododendri]